MIGTLHRFFNWRPILISYGFKFATNTDIFRAVPGCLIMCLWLERKWDGACERVQGLEASRGGPGGGRRARLWWANASGVGGCWRGAEGCGGSNVSEYAAGCCWSVGGLVAEWTVAALVRGAEYVRGSRADGGERRRCCEGGLCERWWWGRGLWWRKV